MCFTRIVCTVYSVHHVCIVSTHCTDTIHTWCTCLLLIHCTLYSVQFTVLFKSWHVTCVVSLVAITNTVAYFSCCLLPTVIGPCIVNYVCAPFLGDPRIVYVQWTRSVIPIVCNTTSVPTQVDKNARLFS